MNKIIKIYTTLYKSFGAQHWWPGETPFEIMIGAILTQNTNWKNVEKAISNIKNEGLLDPFKLNSISKKELEILIMPSGFYRLKAERLKNFLEYFIKDFNGSVEKMKKLNRDELRDYLLSIKGIGKETADSIILYALNKAIFVVDAYTQRILSRHNLIKLGEDYDVIQSIFHKTLPENVKLFNEYHALLVKIGKEFCFRKFPLCDKCPLKHI